jgi:hypothetical protein
MASWQPALVAGDPPIVNIGTVVQAGLQGHDIVLIASSESSYNYSVVARPGINRVEQLKGAVGRGVGSASHNASLILLKKLIRANKDARWWCGHHERRAVDSGRTKRRFSRSNYPRRRWDGLLTCRAGIEA